MTNINKMINYSTSAITDLNLKRIYNDMDILEEMIDYRISTVRNSDMMTVNNLKIEYSMRNDFSTAIYCEVAITSSTVNGYSLAINYIRVSLSFVERVVIPHCIQGLNSPTHLTHSDCKQTETLPKTPSLFYPLLVVA